MLHTFNIQKLTLNYRLSFDPLTFGSVSGERIELSVGHRLTVSGSKLRCACMHTLVAEATVCGVQRGCFSCFWNREGGLHLSIF
jgi:hypothetical protein